MTMMDVNVVYDDIAYILQSNAASSDDVHISTASIDGLVAVENQLLGQLNHHVAGEDDPQWLVLYHSVSQRPRFWVHRVLVRGISDHVKFTTFPSLCILTKPNGAVG